MKATEFEYRHETLLHQLIVGVAFLTYLLQPDDVVWQFVKNRAEPHPLERALFMVAALLIASGAAVCTWARAKGVRPGGYPLHRRYLGEFCYAVGLGSLAPPLGFVILVVAEGIRLLRLIRRESAGLRDSQIHSSSASVPGPRREAGWRIAFRREAVKWGVVITMSAFVITLQDRIAEVLLVVSFLLGVLLNAPFFRSTTTAERSA